MEKPKSQTPTMIHYITFLLFLTTLPSSLSQDTPKNFIIHVSKSHRPATFTSLHHWYTTTLTSLPPPHHSKKLLYTYQHAFHGFSAHLTDTQADILRNIPGILKVTRDRIAHLHTTRTPQFLGLSNSSGIWVDSKYADDVIIGVLDTGIWPECRSFNDAGLSPIPAKWKGGCVTTSDFPVSACNKKLIGAKFFSIGYEAEMGLKIGNKLGETRSPRDTEGHGTHTASTAAGSVVKDVGFYDLARGEARGMASNARLAIYKTCWKDGCSGADILAALDQAVDDGVDVVSISVGLDSGIDYIDDPFAIGAFGAVAQGILVSCSAGNSGPGEMTLENIAPWILTVGAGSIDRDFSAEVVLGDGSVYHGISLYSGATIGSDLPVVYAKDYGHRLCVPGALKNVEGKIVLCDGGINSNVQKGSAVQQAGGVGMILVSSVNTAPGGPGDVHILPATMVDPTAGTKIRKYINDTRASATATIRFKGTVIGGIAAPKVAQFSSRGPNDVTPGILKPDLIAPGVNILAGWSQAASPSELAVDSRRVEFSFQSGTSMATPHVSGIAALLRKAYPSWSPAAIKSALMTTAYNVDNTGSSLKDLATGKPSIPFDHGSGHVDPNKALDPGLVYDLGSNDYIGFLCSIGYDTTQITTVIQGSAPDCSTIGLASPGDLNYPSFSVVLKPGTNTATHKRVLTNVGKSDNVVYNVKVSSPSSVEIVVSPSKLVFSPTSKSLSYEVTFTTLGDDWEDILPQFGWIEWSDGTHKVRSPVALALGEKDFVSVSSI
ncbi:hypothetical protein ACHQM5_018390 [Ranunculus cassubicifolius]